MLFGLSVASNVAYAVAARRGNEKLLRLPAKATKRRAATKQTRRRGGDAGDAPPDAEEEECPSWGSNP